MFTSFKNYHVISEAIPLSITRNFIKPIRDEGKYKSEQYTNQILDQVFRKYGTKKFHRIYIPAPIKFVGSNSPIFLHINDILIPKGFYVVDYINGLASDESKKQHFKIGKLLNKLISAYDNRNFSLGSSEEEYEDKKSEKEKLQDLLKSFINDPLREIKTNEKYEIVISRHPYDIIGMSTDRAWTSCMELFSPKIIYFKNKHADDVGSQTDYVKSMVKNGTLVAYLITKNDRNINRPLSRVVIKPYVDEKLTNNSIYWLTSETIYGIKNEYFQKIVKDWIDTHINTTAQYGQFEMDKGNYEDEDPKVIQKLNPEYVEKLINDNLHNSDPKSFEYIKNVWSKFIQISSNKNQKELFKLNKKTKIYDNLRILSSIEPTIIIGPINDKLIQHIENLKIKHLNNEWDINIRFINCIFEECEIFLNERPTSTFKNCQFKKSNINIGNNTDIIEFFKRNGNILMNGSFFRR